MEHSISGGKAVRRALLTRFHQSDLKAWIYGKASPYRELMAWYRCAMMEVETKFKVMNEELSLRYDRNPIESIKTRLKSPESIVEKLTRKGLPLSPESVEENVSDIAGVRVICSYTSDIYMLSEALLRQDGIELIREKDYIRQPKPNGYRSLHLIVAVPIFLHDQKKMVKVEVQLRTISMDWWASLEHKIRYKKGLPSIAEVERELYECAQLGAELEARMENIQHKVDEYQSNHERQGDEKTRWRTKLQFWQIPTVASMNKCRRNLAFLPYQCRSSLMEKTILKVCPSHRRSSISACVMAQTSVPRSLHPDSLLRNGMDCWKSTTRLFTSPCQEACPAQSKRRGPSRADTEAKYTS